MTDVPSPANLIRWAHQGGAREAPSNTLVAMERALCSGRPNLGLELDVHRTNDGRLVVIHDRSLERTTNGHGRVRRHDLKDLQRLNAGWWWKPGKVDDHSPGAQHPCRDAVDQQSLRVPTLEEVLELRDDLGPEVPITIEVKGWRAATPLVDLLHARPSVSGEGRITVTSFLDPILWIVRGRIWHHGETRIDLSPGAGYMFVFWLRALLGLLPLQTRYARLQIPVRAGVTFATPRLIRAAQQVWVRRMAFTDPDRRLEVDVWTVDDRPTLDALIRLGVNGIMTDCPSDLDEAVEEAQAATGI